MAYSIPVRSSGIINRPLTNLTQPMHFANRFNWVQKPEYTPPNLPISAKTMAAKGKPFYGPNMKGPQRGL